MLTYLLKCTKFFHTFKNIIASHAGVFSGVFISSLPTNTICGCDEVYVPQKILRGELRK